MKTRIWILGLGLVPNTSCVKGEKFNGEIILDMANDYPAKELILFVEKEERHLIYDRAQDMKRIKVDYKVFKEYRCSILILILEIERKEFLLRFLRILK
jgi:hypothetical protein